jgi:hypothetical protein
MTHILSNELINEMNSNKRQKLDVFGKCSICLEDIKKRKKAFFLPCCHYFHRDCVEEWLEINITCPECRIPIFIQDNDQYETYVQYNIDQKNDTDYVRRNIQNNDNAIAIRFIRNPELFDLENVEYEDFDKFEIVINQHDPTFQELYGHMNSDIENSDIENSDIENSEIENSEVENSEIEIQQELSVDATPPNSPNIFYQPYNGPIREFILHRISNVDTSENLTENNILSRSENTTRRITRSITRLINTQLQ